MSADATGAPTSQRMLKEERVAKVNEMIGVIAANGRKFLAHNGNVARLEIDARGKVWFIDYYSGRRIYTHYHGRWSGFTSGGTMRNLCEAFRDFIRDGSTLHPGAFGPWALVVRRRRPVELWCRRDGRRA
jgi:hypothetical protein